MNDIAFKRHRRLRSSASMRALVRENHLRADDFIYPMFVIEGEGIKNEVPSMPGVYQVSLDLLLDEVKEVYDLGIKAIMFFGVITAKDEIGTGAYIDDGIVQKATRLVKKEFPDLLIVADT